MYCVYCGRPMASACMRNFMPYPYPSYGPNPTFYNKEAERTQEENAVNYADEGSAYWSQVHASSFAKEFDDWAN